MATAIISGMLLNSFVEPENIYICDHDSAKCLDFKNQGVTVCDDAESVTKSSDIVVVAVKPQNYAEVLSGLSDIDCCDKIFVSIAAGISIDFVRSKLNQNVKVVRVMPNTPLLLSKGATAICPSADMSNEEAKPVKDMFSLSGVVEEFTEDHMNEIIAVNGSSPAFFYLFAKAMADYADECSIDREKAVNLICATFEGAAAMIKNSGDDIDTLIKKVSSPGGTTLEALSSFSNNNFEDIIKEAMRACTKRADELSK